MLVRARGHWVGLFAWMAAVAGCGSEPAEDGKRGGGETGGPSLQIFFPKLYSAYIEGSAQEFQVPAVVGGIKPDAWECSDPGAVVFDQDAVPNGVLITMRKAGTFKIRATSGRQYGEVDLAVTAATEEQLQAGEKRYNNQVKINWGGIGRPTSPQGVMVMPEASCKNCHGSGADALAVEHTPQQTGGYSDDEIRAIFSMGMKPAGAQYGSFPGIEMFYPIFHRWEASEEEYQGLIVYLRSLKPVSQGPLDFMGLLDRIRRGMMGAGGNTGAAGAATAGTTGGAAGSGKAGAPAGEGGAAGEGTAGAAGDAAAGAGGQAAAGAGGEAAAGSGGEAAAGSGGGTAAGAGGQAAAGAGGEPAAGAGAGGA